MSKDLRFPRKTMQMNYSTRRHSCIGCYICGLDSLRPVVVGNRWFSQCLLMFACSGHNGVTNEEKKTPKRLYQYQHRDICQHLALISCRQSRKELTSPGGRNSAFFGPTLSLERDLTVRRAPAVWQQWAKESS
ncbi:hypothetical protein QQF64_014913 [Cirrhinus molitorella]|uniref:Uncharacterized protein n=1 Tax=Cirrhinus molitorella TaxID=172907 RepID=A0ABR3NUI0_9TELE